MLLLAAGSAEARTLAVRSRPAALVADGSDRAPFRTIAAALLEARDGDEIVVGPGLYTERVELTRRVRLRGPRTAVLVGPEASDTVVRILAPATLEGLSVQGGAIGVEVRADARLLGLHFSAQRTAAIAIEGARAEVEGGELSSTFDRKSVGIDVLGKGELHGRAVRLRGPFRFGIRARDARLRLSELDIEGAYVGVGCLEGCDGEVVRSVVAQGQGAGLLVGAGKLLARDNLISRYEHCVTANTTAVLTMFDNATAFCELAAIGAFGAKADVAHHLHVGPANTAAIELVGTDATIRDSVLIDPGIIGVGMRGGNVELTRLVVRGARPDRDGLFGDAIYAMSGSSLVVRGAMLESNAGTALTANATPVRASGLEGWFNRIGGVLAQNRSSIRLLGASLGYNVGPGLVAIESASIDATGGRLWRNGEGAATAACGEAAAVRLSGVRIDPELAAPIPCVSRGP